MKPRNPSAFTTVWIIALHTSFSGPGKRDRLILFACLPNGVRTSLRGITVNTFLIVVLTVAAGAFCAALGYLLARQRTQSEERGLREEHNRLSTELKVTAEQRDQARSQVEELREERDQARKRQHEHESASAELHTKMEVAHGRIGTLEAELAAARDKHQQAVTEIAGLRKSLDDAQRQVQDAKGDLSASGKDRAALQAVIDELKGRIGEHEADLAKLRTERTELEKRQAEVAAAQAQLEKVREEHTRVQAEQIKSAVAEMLNTSKEKLAGTADEKLGATAKVVTEKIQELDRHLRDFESRRTSTEAQLKEQLKSLAEESARGREQTATLVEALRKPQVRGQWGELQLKRTVELANMREHVDFELQSTVTDDDGHTLRPDMVVKLTGDRQVVVDAKVSLDAFLSALEAADATERERLMGEHARQVRRHVDALAAKAYFDKVDGSPDFVLMFLPNESLLQAALDEEPKLYEYALGKKVVIASPTVLVPMLRTIALTWTETKMRKNAQEIHKLGRDIYDRLGTLSGHLAALGGSLDKSVEHYNKTIGSLERNVLPAARRFPELGVSSPKELPELDPVSAMTREQKAPELMRTITAEAAAPAIEAADQEPEALG